MNYKSQLKGWAVDRVIEAKKAGYDMINNNLSDLMIAATALAEYAYVPREDLESTAKDLFELVRNAPDSEESTRTLEALIGTLEHIKNDREHQFMKPKANGEATQAVQ